MRYISRELFLSCGEESCPCCVGKRVVRGVWGRELSLLCGEESCLCYMVKRVVLVVW